jgi:uncharacterized Zn finger protein (UPF0148 family)
MKESVLDSRFDPEDPKDGSEFCPFCNTYAQRIEVTGHVQCANCQQVIESCCG